MINVLASSVFQPVFTGCNCQIASLLVLLNALLLNDTVSYKADYRQNIAESWPQSIDDAVARKDWGWKPEYDLSKMSGDMLENLKEK